MHGQGWGRDPSTSGRAATSRVCVASHCATTTRRLRRDANGDHWLHRVEQVFGSYYTFILASAIAHICRGVTVQNFAHTDENDDNAPVGWQVFQRLTGLAYFQGLAALSLSAKNAWFTAPGAAHKPVIKWFVRVLAFLFIVLSIVALAIPKESGYALGVTLICASVRCGPRRSLHSFYLRHSFSPCSLPPALSSARQFGILPIALFAPFARCTLDSSSYGQCLHRHLSVAAC
jgi:hypothetical protein